MQKLVYQRIRQDIEQFLPQIKYVRLWNNQFNREQKENGFLYPAVFIGFTRAEFDDYLSGVQEVDLVVTLYLCFESYKNEDIDVLQLKQDLYKIVNMCIIQNFSFPCRQEERQNDDHDNVQIFETDYNLRGKDFTLDNRPTIPQVISPAFGLTMSWTY